MVFHIYASFNLILTLLKKQKYFQFKMLFIIIAQEMLRNLTEHIMRL